MKILLRILTSLALLSFFLNAFAHTSLKDSVPTADAVLSGTPKELTLNFAKAVRLAKITLNEKLGGPVAIDFKPSVQASTIFSIILPLLSTGYYTVIWTVIGSDGHKVSGDFNFTVSDQVK